MSLSPGLAFFPMDTALPNGWQGSDGISRNYKHYNNLALAFGRNPFYPFEHEEIKDVLLLINNLINLIGDEQSKVGNFTFKNFI